MATNRLSVIIDVAVDQANRGLKSFRQSIQDADTTAGKLKAGFGSAMDSVKANAGNLALAGGAALAAFGAKAVGAFQDTALEAGRLADSLGLTTEEASRFMEVAGDMGIDVGTLEKSIGKMNIEVAKSPAYFDQIGAAIAKNADGTTNVQQTFLNVVDAINRMPDASKRAEASQKLLGRGWKDMAELVGKGSVELKKSLDSVSDAKVIDAQEVEKARKYREAMDNLADSAEDLSLIAGESLVPVLTQAAEALQGLKDAAGAVDDALGPVDEVLGKIVKTSYDWLNPMGQAQKVLGWFRDDADKAASSTEAFEARMYTMQGASRDLGTQLEDTADGYTEFAKGMIRESKRVADKLTADWDRILGKIDEEQAYRNAKAGFDDVRDAAFAAWTEGGEALEAYRDQQLQTNETLALYMQQLGNIPPEKATEVLALVDKGEFDKAEAMFNYLTRTRLTRIQASIPRVIVDPGVRGPAGFGTVVVGATGGIVTKPTMALIGEAGPEAVVPLDSTPGSSPLPKGMGGGGTTIVNVYPQIGTDELKLAKYLREVLAKGDRNGGVR